MDRLNNFQLCYILNISKEKAFSMIKRSEGTDIEFSEERFNKKNEPMKDKILTHVFDISKFSRTHEIDLRYILEDMRENFVHSKECVEGVFKVIDKKLKPSGKSGTMPLSVELPKELRGLLSEESYAKLKELVEEQFAPRLKMKDFTIQIR